MNPDLVLFSLTLLIVGVIFAVLPHVTRPELLFAVTVTRKFRESPAAKSIVRRFQAAVIGVTAAAVILFFSIARLERPLLHFLVLAGQILSVLAAFLVARRTVLPYAAPPEGRREAELQSRPEVIPGGLLAAVGPLILVAVAVAASVIWWESLPSRLPIHIGFSGPDRWVETSAGGLAKFFLMMGSSLVLFLLIIVGLSRAIGRAAGTGERGAAEIRFRRITIGMLLAVSYLLAAQTWISLFAGDSPFAGRILTGIGLILTAAVGICLVVMFRMGQGGHRQIGDSAPTREAGPQGDQRPDQTWKLGLFYYNPDDPAIFVEKRFGVGYTVNFGNRWTWLALIILLSAILAAIRFDG